MKGAILRLWRYLPLPESAQVRVLGLLHRRFTVGVVAVLLDEDGKVVLFRHTYRRRYPWGLPGGVLQPGESPAQALVREVAEEAGLPIQVERLVEVRSHPRLPVLDVVYLARVTQPLSQARPDQGEVDLVASFPLHALPPVHPDQEDLIRRVCRPRNPTAPGGA
jgi:8-oxo-dGTP diphosphatase